MRDRARGPAPLPFDPPPISVAAPISEPVLARTSSMYCASVTPRSRACWNSSASPHDMSATTRAMTSIARSSL